MTTFEEKLREKELARQEEEAEANETKKKAPDPIYTLPAGGVVLGKAQILGADDIEYEYVPVPEWGGPNAYVKIRSMGGQQRDAFEDSVVNRKKKKGKDAETELNAYNIRAKICALHIVDEEGKLLFSWEDIEALGEKSARPLDRISTRAQILSGITDDDVKELAKNSVTTVSDTSSTNLP